MFVPLTHINPVTDTIKNRQTIIVIFLPKMSIVKDDKILQMVAKINSIILYEYCSAPANKLSEKSPINPNPVVR